MGKRKTHEEFIKEIHELVGNEYSVLGQYNKSNIKIKIKHNLCGHIYEVIPNNFLKNRTRCPKCTRKHDYTGKFEEMKKYIEQTSGSACKVITSEEEFLRRRDQLNVRLSRTPIDLKCKCGNVFTTHWNNFNSKQYPKRQCNECGEVIRKNGIKLDYKDVKHFIEVESKSQCKLLSKEYVHSYDTLIIQCKCGEIFETTWTMFSHGGKRCCNRCSLVKLSEVNRLPYEEVKYFIEVESNSGCKLLSEEYIHSEKELKIQCKCGEIFYRSYKVFKQQNSHTCLACSNTISRGELKTKEFLTNKRINFIEQFKIKKCRNERVLKFDFAILNENNDLLCLIEIDGKQHFEEVEWFGGKKDLKLRQKRDKIKTKYCTDNKIPLIRIPYWNFDHIEEILSQKMKNFI